MLRSAFALGFSVGIMLTIERTAVGSIRASATKSAIGPVGSICVAKTTGWVEWIVDTEMGSSSKLIRHAEIGNIVGAFSQSGRQLIPILQSGWQLVSVLQARRQILLVLLRT